MLEVAGGIVLVLIGLYVVDIILVGLVYLFDRGE